MTTPHRLYVGTIGEGLWISSDGGETFTRAAGGLFVECHVRALAVHPRDDRTLFLGTELGLFRSQDAGEQWQQVDAPLIGKQVWSFVVLPSDPNVMVAGTCPPSLCRTEDGGHTWQLLNVPLRQECPRILWNRVTTVIADPVDKATLWSGVEIDGVRRSDDAGLTWTKLGEGLSSQDIHSMVVVPGKRLLASTNNDLNQSTDNGLTWQPLGLAQVLPHKYFRGLGQKADDPNVVFLGNGDAPPGTVGAVGCSTDGGRTWHAAHLPGPANSTIWNFATHRADPNLVYCSSVSGELYSSTDAGASWTKLRREFGEIRALAWTP